MAEKNSFLNWVGFKESESAAPSSVERIRELESQLNDLRSRRDITSLSKEEFEILATETAMSMIKSAQARESKAYASSERVVLEATRQAKDAIEGAETKARTILSGAEARGRKYITAAEAEAAYKNIKDTEQAKAVRTSRTQMLKDSDWTQIADSTANKPAWSTYRQALRDMPLQVGFPWNVTYPEEP